MEVYSVKIEEASKELTAKQRIAAKDFSNAISIDQETLESPIVIDIAYYVICRVHNEKSDNPDYIKCVVVDKAGNKFVTGSSSFITSMKAIIAEMEYADEEEEYQLEVYRKESKNYKGKQFLTCSIV